MLAIGDGELKSLQINSSHTTGNSIVDWYDFATSFWSVYSRIWSPQEVDRGGKVTIGCAAKMVELLSFLCSECHAGAIMPLYLPPVGARSKSASIT